MKVVSDPTSPTSRDKLWSRQNAAETIARDPGRLALRLQTEPRALGARLKGPEDVVTEADAAVDAERLGEIDESRQCLRAPPFERSRDDDRPKRRRGGRRGDEGRRKRRFGDQRERLHARIVLNNREAYSDGEARSAERFLESGEIAPLLSSARLVFIGRYFDGYAVPPF